MKTEYFTIKQTWVFAQANLFGVSSSMQVYPLTY